jgi:hypothetical protein
MLLRDLARSQQETIHSPDERGFGRLLGPRDDCAADSAMPKLGALADGRELHRAQSIDDRELGNRVHR